MSRDGFNGAAYDRWKLSGPPEPRTCTCPECEGECETEQDCPDCLGSGWAYYYVPGELPWGECPECSGKGTRRQECLTCGGCGEIYDD